MLSGGVVVMWVSLKDFLENAWREQMEEIRNKDPLFDGGGVGWVWYWQR